MTIIGIIRTPHTPNVLYFQFLSLESVVCVRVCLCLRACMRVCTKDEEEEEDKFFHRTFSNQYYNNVNISSPRKKKEEVERGAEMVCPWYLEIYILFSRLLRSCESCIVILPYSLPIVYCYNIILQKNSM